MCVGYTCILVCSSHHSVSTVVVLVPVNRNYSTIATNTCHWSIPQPLHPHFTAVSRTVCSSSCGGNRCFFAADNVTLECCDQHCVGGCTGVTAADCFVSEHTRQQNNMPFVHASPQTNFTLSMVRRSASLAMGNVVVISDVLTVCGDSISHPPITELSLLIRCPCVYSLCSVCAGLPHLQ